MESEKNYENIPDNLNIVKPQNDYIDRNNNKNSEIIKLKDNAQDNAEIIQIKNNNNVNNNNINIDNNNGDNNNIIFFEMNNKNNEEKSFNDFNRENLKQTTIKNLTNPITYQNINENNIINNQSPNQVDGVYQQNNDIKEDLSCKEKYPNCYCNIKLIFCYNCFDDSEENRKKKENAPVYNTFFLIVLLYYLFFIITEILLFVFILLKYICICLYKCCVECCKIWDEAKKKAEIERQKNMERDRQRINEINNNLNQLDKEHDKMDRNIVFGNPLNDPGYQARVIDFQDRRYLEQRESLERERSELQKKY